VNREEEVLSEYLSRTNMRETSQRRIILRAFMSTETHLTVDDLYRIVAKENPSIGYSTVYRTLKLLSACGLARRVQLTDGKSLYEHNFNHKHHDHLVCMSCGKIIEVESPEIEQLQDKLVKEHYFTPQWHRLEIFGICSQCSTTTHVDLKKGDIDESIVS